METQSTVLSIAIGISRTLHVHVCYSYTVTLHNNDACCFVYSCFANDDILTHSIVNLFVLLKGFQTAGHMA